jgi:hypothetical protein
LRSCRRAAVNAASTAADHSSSVLVNPQTWLGVRPRSRSTAGMACGHRWPRGAVAAPGLGAASALGLVREFSGRCCVPECTRRSDTHCAIRRSCRASHCSPQNAIWAIWDDKHLRRCDQHHPERGDVAGIDAVRMSKREQHLALRERFHDHQPDSHGGQHQRQDPAPTAGLHTARHSVDCSGSAPGRGKTSSKRCL